MTELYQQGMIEGMTPAEKMLLLGIAERRAKDGSGRRIRVQANVPMRLMAEHVGVKIATISRWENGQRRPSGEAGLKWALWLETLARTNAKTAA